MIRKSTLKAAAGLAAIVLALVLALPALADGGGAIAWLQARQNPDGGFGGPPSTVGATADVVLAAAAAGQDALAWSRDGHTPYTFMQANAAGITSVGDLSKSILALVAGGKNPRDLGGADLVTRLEGLLGANGRYGSSGLVNDQAYAMIALAGVRRPIPAAAIDALLAQQIEDGTWSWNGDTTPGLGDNNTAAMAVIALRAAGVPADHAQIQKTLAHFEGQQNPDGGFPYIKPSPYGTASDANSTAVVMWAIRAAGQDPAGGAWKYEGQDGLSPLDRLRAFQNPSGAFRWQDAIADDNMMATLQAPIALELKTLPFATMDVGEAAAPGAAEPAPAVLLPESGANLWLLVPALLGGGAALVAAGLRVRRSN